MSKFRIENGLFLMSGKRMVRVVKTISSIEEVSPGRFEGMAAGFPFVIEGGKAKGGAANEWFLTWGSLLKDVPCSGPVDAFHLIETC
jgi:hypothetical protein